MDQSPIEQKPEPEIIESKIIEPKPSKQPNLIHKHENLLFGLLVAASIITILFAVVLTFLSFGIVLFVLGLFLSFALFAHWMQLGYIRTNGVKVTERQFTDLYEVYQRVGRAMGIRMLPDVYILQQDGVLNAFATRFFQRNMVVLYADIAKLSREGQVKEVEFIVAHELAHIQRGHVQKQWFVLLGSLIPFLGTAYSRACEYTCDRMAAHYIQDVTASKQALTILAVGGQLAKEVNEADYLLEASRENGFIAKYSELLSTHPTLPKRIAAIAEVNGEVAVPVFKVAGYVKYSLISTIVFGVFVNVGLIAFLSLNDEWVEPLTAAVIGETDMMMDEDYMADYTEEPLQTLTYDHASLEEIEAELANGADVNMQDDYGDTPLHNLFYSDGADYDTVQLLLDAGADVTIENMDGDTALDLATDYTVQDAEVIALLESYME